MSEDAAFDLELAATSMLGDSKDVKALLKALAVQLSEPLGERLHVERSGGRLHKSDEVKALKVDLGGEDYEAALESGGLVCMVGHTSGGIRIRSEKVSMDEWLRRLLGRLQVEAEHSQAARLALENMVIGGQQ